jgi:hypothetical protein
MIIIRGLGNTRGIRSTRGLGSAIILLVIMIIIRGLGNTRGIGSTRGLGNAIILLVIMIIIRGLGNTRGIGSTRGLGSAIILLVIMIIMRGLGNTRRGIGSTRGHGNTRGIGSAMGLGRRRKKILVYLQKNQTQDQATKQTNKQTKRTNTQEKFWFVVVEFTVIFLLFGADLPSLWHVGHLGSRRRSELKLTWVCCTHLPLWSFFFLSFLSQHTQGAIAAAHQQSRAGGCSPSATARRVRSGLPKSDIYHPPSRSRTALLWCCFFLERGLRSRSREFARGGEWAARRGAPPP